MAKPFVFSDESINSYGFYLKNDGADISQFKKNPILLWMHKRPREWNDSKNEVLALGTVDSVKYNQEKQRWEAVPVFDMEDDFAAEIARKWEKGVYRMVSPGVKVIEWSSDPKYLKKGQTSETALKWILKEISIVDIGSNNNAIALYNDDDELITLSEGNQNSNIPKLKLSTKNRKTMDEITLADGTKLESVADVQKLYDKNAANEQKLVTLTAERDGLKTKVDGYETAQKDARKAEAVTLVDAAVKDGRIDATPDKEGKSAKENWMKFFETDHEGAKSALSSIPKRKSVTTQLENEGEQNQTELADLKKQSWDELDKNGGLVTLKDKYFDVYEEKFEAKFGKKPTKV